MAQTPPSPRGNQAVGKGMPQARSFLRDDFPYLRRASIALFSAIAIGAALVGGSEFLLQKQLDAKNQAQPLDSEARGKYAQARNEQREILDFQPKYAELLAKGFVGEEERLDWMEGIQHIQEQHALLPIKYEISAQQPFQVDATLKTGTLELRGSKMLVTISLLHEMDLLNFLDDLREKYVYGLHDCTIKRLKLGAPDKLSPGQSAESDMQRRLAHVSAEIKLQGELAQLLSAEIKRSDTLAPRLSAECTLYWITLGKVAAADGAEPQADAANKEGR